MPFSFSTDDITQHIAPHKSQFREYYHFFPFTSASYTYSFPPGSMPTSSLKTMSYRACSRYLRNLHDLGDCPVNLVVGLLPKIDSAEQLKTLEQNSPQLVGHTKEAWIHLIQRDVPNYENMMPFENWKERLFTQDTADRWHKVYFKLKKRAMTEAREREKELAAAMNGIKETREQGSAPILDRKLVSTGKNRYAKATFNYNDALYRSGGRATGGKASEKSFFEKLGKTAGTKANSRMRTPTHLLKRPVLGGAVHKAPLALVEDLRERERLKREKEEAERAMKERESTMIRPPRSTGVVRPPREGTASSPPLHRPLGQKPYDMMQDREARLRNLKTGNSQMNDSPTQRDVAKLTEAFLESGDDDDDDDAAADDDDATNVDEDLFGESKPTTTIPPSTSPPAKLPAHPDKQPASLPTSTHQPQIQAKRKASAPLFRPNKR